MDYPGVDLIRESGHYIPFWAGLAVQLTMLVRRAAGRGRRSTDVRPASDATWFLPVYLCALSSLYHGWFALFGISHCWGVPLFVFGEHAVFAFKLIAAAVALGFAAEHIARHVGLPAREAQGTLPMGVVAALLATAWAWVALTLFIVPVF